MLCPEAGHVQCVSLQRHTFDKKSDRHAREPLLDLDKAGDVLTGCTQHKHVVACNTAADVEGVSTHTAVTVGMHVHMCAILTAPGESADLSVSLWKHTEKQ